MGKKPSEEQRAFARAYVLEGKNPSDAYRAAYPAAAGLSAKEVSRRANSTLHTKAVGEEIRRLQAQSAEAFSELVTRESLLRDVTELIEKSKKSAYARVPDAENLGEWTDVLNDRAGTVLLRAIERAAKMIGADEPERVQNDVVVTFEGDFDKYAE